MIIYCTTNLINFKKYIGQDSNNNPNYFGSGLIIKRAIEKYKKENFKKEILCYCNSLEELNEMEDYYIDYYSAVKSPLFYNIKPGGNKPGYKHTFETKLKISKIHKGKTWSLERKEKMSKLLKGRKRDPKIGKKISLKNTGRKGTPLTKEHKIKISAANKGRVTSEKTKVLISIANMGKRRTPEQKKKQSELAKSLNRKTIHTETTKLKISISKNPIPILQFTKEGDFIKEWRAASEVQKSLKLSATEIHRCCAMKIRTRMGANGNLLYVNTKSVGGFVWKYKII